MNTFTYINIHYQAFYAFAIYFLVKSAQMTIRMGMKGDFSDFEHGAVFVAIWAGQSISKTADLLGFLHITISRVYSGLKRENIE